MVSKVILVKAVMISKVFTLRLFVAMIGLYA
jgi:hypothetical protein